MIGVSAFGCAQSTTADLDGGAALDTDSAIDAGAAIDATSAVDCGTDTGAATCSGHTMGTCPCGLTCMACWMAPTMGEYFCTLPCTTDANCPDPSRPHCLPGLWSPTGSLCVPSSYWRCNVTCASPDTMIATPSGERRIADLVIGDLVYSADEGSLRAVPLVRVTQTPVADHRVVHVELDTARVLEISPGHPTADGRWFADLRAGDRLDGARVVSAELVPYLYGFTYDVLPDSDTGTYVAGGVLVGSTLAARSAPIALSAH